MGAYGGTQGFCLGCHSGFRADKPSRRFCGSCRTKQAHAGQATAPTNQPTPSPQALLLRNVTNLMAELPVHSHHRAPLLQSLSRDIPSAAAAPLLRASASYIRDCKRKDYAHSDLLTQKYAPGTKRQRLSHDTLSAVFDFLIHACPTHSGSKTISFTQFINDDQLYKEYKDSRPTG